MNAWFEGISPILEQVDDEISSILKAEQRDGFLKGEVFVEKQRKQLLVDFGRVWFIGENADLFKNFVRELHCQIIITVIAMR